MKKCYSCGSSNVVSIEPSATKKTAGNTAAAGLAISSFWVAVIAPPMLIIAPVIAAIWVGTRCSATQYVCRDCGHTYRS
jgi:hypothetical protein